MRLRFFLGYLVVVTAIAAGVTRVSGQYTCGNDAGCSVAAVALMTSTATPTPTPTATRTPTPTPTPTATPTATP